MAEMEAGRELDALVAEKVMGWKIVRITDGARTICACEHNCGCPDPFCPKPDQVALTESGCWRARIAYSNSASIPFRPSVEMEAAWMVVEKMRERGYMFECGTRFDEDREGIQEDMYAQFWNAGVPLGNAYHAGPIAQAICLDALAALEPRP